MCTHDDHKAKKIIIIDLYHHACQSLFIVKIE